jgi:hypothetical protein
LISQSRGLGDVYKRQLQADPKTTSPTIVAFSATKQSSGICGYFPFISFIIIVKKTVPINRDRYSIN